MTKSQLKKTYQEEIKRIVSTLRAYNPERIILFGSAARGEIKGDSDIDLCIIKKGEDRLKMKEEIWDLLWKADFEWGIEPDIHVYPPEIYQDWLKRGDPFIAEIEKGKVVYEKQV